MTGRVFVDTNVWVYAVDAGEQVKRARALDVLKPAPQKDYVVSTQVLGEFYTTVTGKLRQAVSLAQAQALINLMKGLSVVAIDLPFVEAAIEGVSRWGISYWDALIVAAASSAGCGVLLTEDLSDGATYGAIRVENPFRDLTSVGTLSRG